jgi:hypothetical protein
VSTHHPSTGADISAALFRTQRMNQVTAPQRIDTHLNVALDVITGMDEADSDLHDLALVIWHCTKALCTALDTRS